MKLDLGILVGAESKQWLADMAKLVERLEAAVRELSMKDKERKATDEDEEDDDDFSPKATPVKRGTPFEDEEEDGEEISDEEMDADEEEDEDDDFKTPVNTKAPKKAASKPAAKKTKEQKEPKSRKVTSDDCNDAARKLASSIGGKAGRQKVFDIMSKKFGVDSVLRLQPEQYPEFIEAMAIS
jgi:hypothetical protein